MDAQFQFNIDLRERLQANDTARAKLGEGFAFRKHIAQLRATKFMVHFIEYFNSLQNKSIILILYNNLYTTRYDEEWIQLNEVISKVDNCIENGYVLLTPDYKKYISHDYDSE